MDEHDLTPEMLLDFADEEVFRLRGQLAACVTTRNAANAAWAGWVRVLREALIEAEEFLDDRADAETPPGASGPIPNDAMRLLMTVRAALEATR